MRLLASLCLIAVISCQPKDEAGLGPEQTMAAYIDDSSMYADGCELTVSQATDSVSASTALIHYKPSEKTLPRVKEAQQRISNGQPVPVRLPVTIRFQTTGKQVAVNCIWVNRTVPEIDVLDVTKR